MYINRQYLKLLSGSLRGNYVINQIWAYQNTYKMDAEALAVIAAGYLIFDERKKTRKKRSCWVKEWLRIPSWCQLHNFT